MNPHSFTRSSITKDSENFVGELKKVFEVMLVVNTERFELDAYQLKSVARTWFDHWHKGSAQGAPPPCWACLEEAFFGRFFSRESPPKTPLKTN